MECSCFPDRILCGKHGSIDLTEWITSPEEGPHGPALFQCIQDSSTVDLPIGQQACKFSEQNLNVLIGQFFGVFFVFLIRAGSIHHSSMSGK
jgi:hypothetical protein